MTRKTLLVFLSFLLATGINARSVGLFGHDKLDANNSQLYTTSTLTGIQKSTLSPARTLRIYMSITCSIH